MSWFSAVYLKNLEQTERNPIFAAHSDKEGTDCPIV